jgi:hypothetical protein
MSADMIALIKLIGDFAIFPLCAILWNMQGRLSRIEGLLAPRNRFTRQTDED